MFGSSGVKAIIRFVEATPGVLRCLKANPEFGRLRFYGTEDLIIVGTGPSLRRTLTENLQFFDGKRTLCVNEFAHSEYFEKLRPDYYVLTDPAYWRKAQDVTIEKMIKKSVGIMKDGTAWKMTLLMNSSAREWNYFMDLPEQNRNIDIVYFDNNTVSCFRSLKLFFYKTNRAMPLLYNTLGVGIFLGLNMGFRTIYVVGADHNWHEEIHVDKENILYWRNPHFSDEGELEYHPMYVDGYKNTTFKMHQILHSLSLSFQGYVELEEYSRFLGAKIYNASARTFIDAFERYAIASK